MYKIIEIDGVKLYADNNGILYMSLEDVAYKIGITKISPSKNQVVRWDRLIKMINEVIDKYGDEVYKITKDKSGKIGKDSFINREFVYMLAMMANNDRAREFQNEISTVIIPKFMNLYPNYEGQSLIMQTVNQSQNKVKDHSYIIPENKDDFNNRDYLYYLANEIAKQKKIPIQFVIRDFVDLFDSTYNTDLMNDKKIHRLHKNKRGNIVEMAVFDYLGTDDDATKKASKILNRILDNATGRDIANLIFEIKDLQNQIATLKYNLNQANNDNTYLRSQIQYFVDAAKNNLKVAAYCPNHMGI